MANDAVRLPQDFFLRIEGYLEECAIGVGYDAFQIGLAHDDFVFPESLFDASGLDRCFFHSSLPRDCHIFHRQETSSFIRGVPIRITGFCALQCDGGGFIFRRTKSCPPKKRAASTKTGTAGPKGFVAAFASREVRDGKGTVADGLALSHQNQVVALYCRY